jgi:hypothetical protein
MSEYIHDELIAANHALLQRVNELEQKNKKLENDYKNAMETVGRMAVRIADLEKEPVGPVRSQGLISPVRSQGLPWPEDTPEEERVNFFADKVRQLDEIRKKKREEEKRPHFLRHGPLPKPLLSRSRRLTMDDLSTERLSTDHVLFEEPILSDQRDGLMEGLGRHLENIRRERSSSLADTELLAKKRFPR